MRKELIVSLSLFLSLAVSSCNLAEYIESGKEQPQESFTVLDDFQEHSYEVNEKETLNRIYFKNPSMEVLVNQKTFLEVCFDPVNYSNKNLNYTISDSSYGSITDDGYLTAKKVGTFKVTATGPYGIATTCKVSSGSGPVESISLNNSAIDLTIKEKTEKSLSYTVYPQGAFQDIKVKVANENVASFFGNRVIAKGAGTTEVTVYDDANHNDIQEEDEKATVAKVNVHDFTDIGYVTAATHTLNGEIIRYCKCGCGAQREEVIPATGHNLDEGEVLAEVTCTTNGKRRRRCKDPLCGYVHEETISALGHRPTIKEVKKENIAKLGDFMNKTQYYCKCDRCMNLTETTFGYGHHDDFFTQRIPSFFKTTQEAANYKSALINTINTIEENKEESFTEYGCFEIDFDPKHKYDKTTCANIINTACSFAETYPWVDCNSGVKYYTWGGYVDLVLVYPSDEYILAENRKKIDGLFSNIHKQFDPLIRDNASDLEIALIIALFTAQFITYDKGSTESQNYFVNTLVNGYGVCHSYAMLVNHLAHRYNLPCMYVLSDTRKHAWNNVYIDGTWYTLDATFSDLDISYLLREAQPSNNHASDNVVNTMVKSDTKSIRDSLIRVYKNNEFDGIYYNLDTALDTVNDSDANYKIILGVGIDGLFGFAFSDTTEAYYEYSKAYETKKESVECKSLKIERCTTLDNEYTYKPELIAPASLINQSNVSFSLVRPTKK